MSINSKENKLRRLASLFRSIDTAPAPAQLQMVLNSLEYQRFTEALGLYEVVKVVINNPEKEYSTWATLPTKDDILFFNSFGVFTV